MYFRKKKYIFRKKKLKHIFLKKKRVNHAKLRTRLHANYMAKTHT